MFSLEILTRRRRRVLVTGMISRQTQHRSTVLSHPHDQHHHLVTLHTPLLTHSLHKTLMFMSFLTLLQYVQCSLTTFLFVVVAKSFINQLFVPSPLLHVSASLTLFLSLCEAYHHYCLYMYVLCINGTLLHDVFIIERIYMRW